MEPNAVNPGLEQVERAARAALSMFLDWVRRREDLSVVVVVLVVVSVWVVVVSVVDGSEEAVDGPVGDSGAVPGSGFDRVAEVEAHIDAGDRVLVGRLEEAGEVTERWGDISAGLPGREGVAADREAGRVGAEEALQHLRCGPTLDSVPGVVIGDGRILQERRPGRVCPILCVGVV